MDVMSVITLTFVAAHAIILIYMWVRIGQKNADFAWLAATIVVSGGSAAIYALEPDLEITDDVGRALPLISMIIALLTTFGTMVLRDSLDPKRRVLAQRIWIGTHTLWLIAMIALAFATDSFIAGQDEWLLDLLREPDASALLMIVGMGASGLGLLVTLFVVFYQARLPEMANRALFWVLVVTTLMLGVLMVSSGTNGLAVAGLVLQLTALIAAVYASNSYRVFDIRSAMLLSTRTISFVFIAATLTFAALFITFQADLEANVEGISIMVGIAVGIAALYVPLRQISEAVIQRFNARNADDPAQITREYSRTVSEAVELERLLQAATTKLTNLMQVRGSCLILLNSTFRMKDAVELLVMYPGNSTLDRKTGYLSIHSPVYGMLAAKHRPISQFDLEFAPEYAGMSSDERQFFREMGMSAYAPVILENALIGILACGPRLNDTAFYPRDLELLSTLAQQTGVALRNARLVDDLQHLNKNMQGLNRTLKTTNEQLNRMDAVKTDFVTIASHELRTPLAQIRGYTDIVDALNEQGMLDKEQTNNLVANLRKATERMEELIAAMLDVSQLDVEAMDLRFNQNSVESVLKMAIEPLTDAIKQRKLTLSARGLRGLPAIQADLQRLVQACRNIIINAIKFTPDGGRIEITAELQPAQDENDVDHVLVKITDTGVGVDKQNLEMIFKKFFRAYDPSLHSTGTYKFLGAGPGLGLTIARGVIEGHGGKVWAESPGHDMSNYPGATFYILLPVSTPDDARRVLTFEGDAAGQALSKQGDKPVDTQMKPPRRNLKSIETEGA